LRMRMLVTAIIKEMVRIVMEVLVIPRQQLEHVVLMTPSPALMTWTATSAMHLVAPTKAMARFVQRIVVLIATAAARVILVVG